MTNIRINFSESGVSLPDGTNCGVQGEHNAVQLAVTLPASMIDGCDYHVITFTANDGNVIPSDVIQLEANADGAFRYDRTIYQPLTAAYTQNKTFEIVVTGYRQDGDSVAVVDRTKPVSLWLTPVPGHGKAAYPSGLESHVKELSDYINSMKSGNADDLNRLLMNALGMGGGAKVDEYADLLKNPMTLMEAGVKAEVRKTTKFNRYGFWHGEQPQKNVLYGIIYFSPRLPDVRLFIPEDCPHSFSAVAYFERENEDCWKVELSYFDMLSDFAVMVTDRSHGNTNYSHYYYLYEDKSVYANGIKHELSEGWNHGYADAATGLLTYEPCDAPDPLFDVKCTSISVNGDRSYNAFTVFAMACRPNTPYMATMPHGTYVKLYDDNWAKTTDVNSLFDYRMANITVDNATDAWSFGQQTVYVPGALPGDRIIPYKSWEDFVDSYSITSLCVRHDSITFVRDMTKALPNHSVSLKIQFFAKNPVIPKTAHIDFSSFELPQPKEGHIHEYHVVATIEPTCTDGGYTYHRCNGCDDIYIDNETDALGHDWDEGEITRYPTCSDEGVKTFTCSRCGAVRTEPVAIMPEAHQWDDGEVVIAPTCTDEGQMLYHCLICSETITGEAGIDTDAHDWDEGVVDPETGDTTYTCSRCGHTYTEHAIDVTDIEDTTITDPAIAPEYLDNDNTVGDGSTPPEPEPIEEANLDGPGASAPEEVGNTGGENDAG